MLHFTRVVLCVSGVFIPDFLICNIVTVMLHIVMLQTVTVTVNVAAFFECDY